MINSRRLSRFKLLGSTGWEDSMIKYNLRVGGKKVPVYMRTFSGDIEIFYEVFYRNSYKLEQEPGSVKMIVDLGANIGLTSLYFAEHYPGATIIAVEPDHTNFLLLRQNTQNLCMEKKAVILEAAVADHDGIISFNSAIPKYNSKIAASNKEGYEVKLITLNTLIDQHDIESIDILKMDIEGAESMVFSGNPSWLSIVKNILLEFHNEKEKIRILGILENWKFIVRSNEGMVYKLSKRS